VDHPPVRVHERLDELYAIGGDVGASRVAGSEGEDEAHELARELAYTLAKKAYRL
jgi:hypothetical protein